MTEKEKMEALKRLVFETALDADFEYETPTLNLFGTALQMFIEYPDISELYIRNGLSFLLSHEIISIERYKIFDSIIKEAVNLHEISNDE